MPAGSALLTLPAELRDAIYHCVAVHDQLAFADHLHRPSLLRTCKQIRAEYAAVFFAKHLVAVDAYCRDTDCWIPITAKAAKMALFGRAKCVDLAGFVNSLAGAQRHCQKFCELAASPRPQRRHGIMTLSINGFDRYWLFSCND